MRRPVLAILAAVLGLCFMAFAAPVEAKCHAKKVAACQATVAICQPATEVIVVRKASKKLARSAAYAACPSAAYLVTTTVTTSPCPCPAGPSTYVPAATPSLQASPAAPGKTFPPS